MSERRRATHRVQCAEPSCGEWAHFEYRTRRECDDHVRDLAARPWRCVRHQSPGEVLSPVVTERTRVLVARRLDHLPDHLFWLREDSEVGGSGFAHGPGFKAFAKDFPIGTRLVVTARIEPPASTDAGRAAARALYEQIRDEAKTAKETEQA